MDWKTIEIPVALQPVLELITKKHEKQKRSNRAPYISHLLRVMQRVKNIGIDNIDILSACCEHDLIEDTDCTDEEILSVSSPYTLQLVKELTNNYSDHLPFEEKLIATHKHAKHLSNDAKIIKLADRLDNLLECEDWKPIRIKRYCENTRVLLHGMNEIPSIALPFKTQIINRVEELERKYDESIAGSKV